MFSCLKTITTATLLVAVFVGCTSQPPVIQPIAPSYRDSLVSVESDSNGGVQISMVLFEGGTSFTRAMNDRSSAFYIHLLSDHDNESTLHLTVRGAADSFMLGSMAFTKEFPEAASGMWTLLGKDTVLRCDSIVCLQQQAYLFTGGAHGSTVIRFLVAHSTTGTFLQWKDLVNDTAVFSAVAERAFRAQQGMQPTDTYESKGFWFTDERFVLPKEIGIDSVGFVLLYNQYEIAPYSMGQIRITIPYSEAITTPSRQ